MAWSLLRKMMKPGNEKVVIPVFLSINQYRTEGKWREKIDYLFVYQRTGTKGQSAGGHNTDGE
jgi:hypothetical protein